MGQRAVGVQRGHAGAGLRRHGQTLVHTGLVNGTSYGYRICAVDAAGNVSTGATVIGTPVPETTPPSGTVTINGGAAATRSTAVTLTLTAADASVPIQMCISNTASCESWAWEAFAGTKSWWLAGWSGTQTVNVWYRDRWGNTSAAPVSDTIVIDTTAPANGTVTAAPGDTQLTLNWSGFTDAGGSGITGYQAVYQGGSAPWACSAGTPVPGYAGTATTLVHTGLVNGTSYGYRICAIDAAGNVSTGATVIGTPVPETTPPPDTTPPENGTVRVTADVTGQLTLNWSDFVDEGSGITGYKVVFQTGSPPLTCTPGAPVPGYTGTATMLVHAGLVNGTTYGYRVCAIDAAGNMSSGATVSGVVVQSNCEGCHGKDGNVHAGIDRTAPATTPRTS